MIARVLADQRQPIAWPELRQKLVGDQGATEAGAEHDNFAHMTTSLNCLTIYSYYRRYASRKMLR